MVDRHLHLRDHHLVQVQLPQPLLGVEAQELQVEESLPLEEHLEQEQEQEHSLELLAERGHFIYHALAPWFGGCNSNA